MKRLSTIERTIDNSIAKSSDYVRLLLDMALWFGDDKDYRQAAESSAVCDLLINRTKALLFDLCRHAGHRFAGGKNGTNDVIMVTEIRLALLEALAGFHVGSEIGARQLAVREILAMIWEYESLQ